MNQRRIVISAVLSGLMVAAIAGTVTIAQAAGDSGLVRHAIKVRTVSMPTDGHLGGGSTAMFPEGLRSGDDANILSAPSVSGPTHGGGKRVVNRQLSSNPRAGQAAAPDSTVESAQLGTAAAVGTNFLGLNFYQQRFTNHGNQFSVEPPDQGLCVGNGFVLETVNSVLRVFDTSGTALNDPIDLNTFYGYPAQFNRSTGQEGPFVTDPNCYYDTATNRWFHTALTLEVDPTTGAFLGPNHLDIAVSNSGNPTGSWTIFKIPVQNNGTEGTPNHHCEQGACVGDYPQLGADANAIFITTNEYSIVTLTNASFTSANIYAISKSQLVAGASNPTVVQFETRNAFGSTPGFTLWPTKSVGTSFATAKGGTEYLLNTMATEEARNFTGHDNRLGVWAITNTSSINNALPSLSKQSTLLTVDEYSIPPLGQQKSGDNPLGECVNDTQLTSPFWNGKGCWKLFFNPQDQPAHNEVIPPLLESIDSRMLGTYFAAGNIWGVAGSGVSVGGENRAGVAYYIVHPNFGAQGSLGASIVRQGKFGLAGSDLLMPTIAATSTGQGIIGFARTGGVYPSAAFTTVDATDGAGSIQTAAAGAGPDDGFTGYFAFVGDDINLGSRWGDYSMAVTVGDSIWVGTEYIDQTCSLSQTDSNYLTVDSNGRLATCGKTRGAFGNWATRIWKVTP